jgi:hypothetical protein
MSLEIDVTYNKNYAQKSELITFNKNDKMPIFLYVTASQLKVTNILSFVNMALKDQKGHLFYLLFFSFLLYKKSAEARNERKPIKRSDIKIDLPSSREYRREKR